MKKLILFIFSLVFILSCGSDDSIKKDDPIEEIDSPNLLVQLDGNQLVDADKNPIYLQGAAFNNFIWSDTPLPREHHSELDYQRVKDMGMNTIRFYMNYRYFEDDTNPYTYKQSGWDWLDENIAWAKKYGIYLVLNMHAPQGGYQSQGEGDALWDNIENQNRLAALWIAIAERYKDEVQIAGFGPVNEPVPNSSMTQWSTLSQRLIDDIRTVNQNHIIFIEQAIYVKNEPQDTNLNFPNVTGDNLVYEFHSYQPYYYTHQLLDFSGEPDGGKYPDEGIVQVSSLTWYTASYNNPNLPSGNSDWQFYQGERYTVTDSQISIGVAALIAANVSGTVFFDDVIIKEYDENGTFVRDILEANLNDLSDWSFWSSNDSGTFGLSTTEGNNDTSSLFITGTTDDANMSNVNAYFEAKQNYSYEISGWMNGDAIATDAGSLFRLDFYTSAGPIIKKNKAYLEYEIEQITSWAATKNVALYMGEFGAGAPCFLDNKGGLQYVTDMVDIAKENNIHFTYHSYHEDNFGIYYGDGLPDVSNANQGLIDLFTNILN